MALFMAGAAAFLMIAVVLAHHLKYPADTLGLRAARRAQATLAMGNDWSGDGNVGKPKQEPWYKPRDVWSDDKLIDELAAAHRNGGGGSGRGPGGRKGKDSCMVMLLLMFGGGAAAVVGTYAAVKGLA